MPQAFQLLAQVFLDTNLDDQYMRQVAVELRPAVRGMAGVILKNWVKQNRDHLSPSQVTLIRPGLLQSLASPEISPMIRSTAGSLISTLVGANREVLDEWWPGLISDLASIGTGGAWEALEMVAEDHAERLVHEHDAETSSLILYIIHILNQSEDEVVLRRAAGTLNWLVPFSPDAIAPNLQSILAGLSRSGQRQSLRCVICQSLNLLIQSYPARLAPYIPALLTYTFSVMQTVDEQEDETSRAALEACEFWLCVSDNFEGGPEYIQVAMGDNGFGALIDVILKNMRFAVDAGEVLEQDSSTADGMDDRDADIRPRYRRQDPTSGESSASLEDGEAREGDTGPTEDEVIEWTLRKCSAATLDSLSHSLPDVSHHLLPRLSTLLASSDWRDTEAGILALGAIAEGCSDALEEHLPVLIPLLLDYIKSGARPPLVRAMAIWTCSRFAKHLAYSPHAILAMEAVLYAVAGPFKAVQRAACTAVCRYIESTGENMVVPVLPAVMAAVGCAVRTYHRRNRLLLYDLIRTLADEIGFFLDVSNKHLVALPGLLLEQWSHLKLEDTAMFPLLEALSSLALAAGPAFPADIASSALHRALLTAHSLLHDPQDDTEYDMACLCMDLAGGLTSRPEIFDSSHVASLIENLLVRALGQQVTQVRQAALALVGDMAGHGLASIIRPLELIQQVIMQDYQPTDEVSTSAANNAVWAAGCLALISYASPEFCQPLLERLIHVMASEQAKMGRATPSLHTYMDNVAVCTGRLIGALQLSYQSTVIPGLLPVIPLAFWCTRVARLTDPNERLTSLTPVIRLIMAEPSLDRSVAEPLSVLLKSVQTQMEPGDDLNGPVRELAARIAGVYPDL